MAIDLGKLSETVISLGSLIGMIGTLFGKKKK